VLLQVVHLLRAEDRRAASARVLARAGVEPLQLLGAERVGVGGVVHALEGVGRVRVHRRHGAAARARLGVGL
jgi:hypothetical protein